MLYVQLSPLYKFFKFSGKYESQPHNRSPGFGVGWKSCKYATRSYLPIVCTLNIGTPYDACSKISIIPFYLRKSLRMSKNCFASGNQCDPDQMWAADLDLPCLVRSVCPSTVFKCCIYLNFGSEKQANNSNSASLHLFNVFDWSRAIWKWHLYFSKSTEQESWNYFLCANF